MANISLFHAYINFPANTLTRTMKGRLKI